MSIRIIIEKLKYRYIRRNSTRYVAYLRQKGVRIGEGTKFRSPETVEIDISRPELLEIGEKCFIHKGNVIMTHDWCGWCFINTHKEFYPSHAKVKIGNNVWFGENVCVCKGVTIGDNCIIGIGSVVTKSIPANSIAAGVPARVICSYGEYVEKRSKQYVQEVIEYAQAIIDSGREPTIADFTDDYPCFVDGSNYTEYPYPYMNVFKTEENFKQWCKNHKKLFNGFNEFIAHVKNEISRKEHV